MTRKVIHYNEIEAYYSPVLERLNAAIFDAMLVMSTVLLPLLVYLILCQVHHTDTDIWTQRLSFQSKSIGKYKWYLLNNVVHSYLYDANISLLKPVMLAPVLGGYFDTFIEFDGAMSYKLVRLIVFLMVNMMQSIVMALLYRYAQVSHDSIGCSWRH